MQNSTTVDLGAVQKCAILQNMSTCTIGEDTAESEPPHVSADRRVPNKSYRSHVGRGNYCLRVLRCSLISELVCPEDLKYAFCFLYS